MPHPHRRSTRPSLESLEVRQMLRGGLPWQDWLVLGPMGGRPAAALSAPASPSEAGRVVDARGRGVAGVTVVAVGGDGGATTTRTDSRGRFVLKGSDAADPSRLLIVDGPGASPRGRHARSVGTPSQYATSGPGGSSSLNVVLSPIDLANATDFRRIGPGTAVDVTTPRLPGFALHVEAGAAVGAAGRARRPYRGRIAVTPLAGPNDSPAVAVDGPGLAFRTPAKVTLPNTTGAVPGTTFPLVAVVAPGRIVTWGVLQVSADGRSLDTVSGGLLGPCTILAPRASAPSVDSRTPVLDAAGGGEYATAADLSISVGGTLEASIVPGGLVGKDLTYTITPQPLPANMTFNRGTGELTFVPAPGQAGTYQFRVVARDGGRTVVQDVRVTVAQPELASTVVTGRVVDEAGAPLGDVPVDLGGIATRTDDEGYFALVGVPADPGPVHVGGATVEAQGRLALTAPVADLLGHPIYSRSDNVFPEPLIVPRIAWPEAVGSGDSDAEGTLSVVNPAMPGFEIRIPGDAGGRPSAVSLSVAELPAPLAAQHLPKGTSAPMILGRTTGLAPDQPVELTMPNVWGYAPGGVFLLMKFNPVTGGREPAAEVVVSKDGETLTTTDLVTLGSARSETAPVARASKAGEMQALVSVDLLFCLVVMIIPLELQDNGECANCPPTGNDVLHKGNVAIPPSMTESTLTAGAPLNSDISLLTGEYFQNHRTASYYSVGADRSVDLEYSSLQADPKPVVQYQFTTPPAGSAQTIEKITAIVSLAGVVQGAAVTYDVDGVGLQDGETYHIPMQVDGTSLSPGSYRYTMTITEHFSPSTSFDVVAEGSVNVIDNSAGALGAGWSVGGLQKVNQPTPGGPLVVTVGQQGNQRFNPVYDAGQIHVQDLALASDASTSKIMKNDGTAGFTRPAASSGFVAGTVAADFDGDGEPDQAVATSSSLGILLNDGSGGLTAGVPYSITSGYVARALAVGDFTGHANGILDLAVLLAPTGGSSGYAVAVYTGVGDGTFSTPVVSSVGDGAAATGGDDSMAAGDFDGDGKPDLVFTTADGHLDVMLAATAGAMTPAGSLPLDSGHEAIGVTTVDYNADGKLDLVVETAAYVSGAAEEIAFLNVFAGTGSGGGPFTSTTTTPYMTVGHTTRGILGLVAGNFRGPNAGLEVAVPVHGDVAFQTEFIALVPLSSSGVLGAQVLHPIGNAASPSPGGDASGGNIIATDLNGVGGRLSIAFTDGTGHVRILSPNPDSNQFFPAQNFLVSSSINEVGTIAAAPFTGTAVVPSYRGPASSPSTLVQNVGGTWTRTYPDGTVVQFDSSGRETSLTDRNGNATSYAYVASGQPGAGSLKTITDPVGLKTTFAYDATSGKLASITDPASRATTITVDGNGNLTQIVDPDGAVMQFGYATPSNHRITTETNPRGKTATVLYDAFGLAEGETLFGGADTTTVKPAHANGLLAAGGTLTGPPATDFEGRITDPNNRTTTVGFSWMGHPNKSADDTGASTSTKYDRRGFPAAASDALGRVTAYTYDSRGNVTSIARPDYIPGGSGGSGSGGSGGTSNPMTITYDDQYGVPTSVTDFLGRTTTYTLDSHGNVLRRTDPDDFYEEWTYNSAGQLLTDTDRLGAVTTYHYDSYGRLDRIDNPSGTASYNQDVTYYGTATAGSAPIPGQGAAQAFDGNTATKWLSSGASWLEYQFGAGAAYTVVEYSLTSGDDNSIYPGRAPKDWQLQGSNDGSAWTAVDTRTGQSDAEDEHTTTFTVASPGSYKYYRLNITANNDTPYTYTQLSEVKLTASITTPISAAASHTSFGYDSAGNLTSATDELGKVWNFTYDGMGRTTSTQDSVQAAAGSTVKTLYVYDGNGNPTSVADALSRVTTYAYDDRDRLTSMTEPVHQGTTKHTAYAYDGMNLVSVTDPLGHTTSYAYDEVNRLESVKDALNHTATYTYDLAGQLTNQFDPLGRETRYDYDAKGRLTKIWRESIFGTGLDAVARYEYDDDDNVTRVFDGLNHSVVYSYDEMNRPTKAVDPLDRITTYIYDPMGRVTAQTDPLVHKTARAYDVRGRLVSETAPSGGGTTTYTYDLASRLTSLTDPVGNVTSWTYDDAGRSTTEVDPLGKVTTYAYNLVGGLTQKTDRLGRITQYGYDADDRVTTETWLPAGGGSADNVITYTYDDAGRTTQVQDHVSKYAYGYDAADRLTSVDNDGTTGLPQVTLTYDYDDAGNRTSLDDSLGGLTSYAYDERNQLASLSQSGAGVNSKRVDYAYDHAGRITSLDRYGDLTGTSKAAGTTYSYDFANRLTGLAHKTSGGATIASYDYTLDAASRLTQEVRTWNGGSSTDTLTYGYTDDSQLTGVTHTNGSFANESFSYDANGNRDSTGYSTGTGNRISTDGTYTYAYDAEGNQVSRTEIATDDQTLYIWDHRNRLVEIDSQVDGVTTPLARYVYDALDRRIGLLHGPDAAAPFVAEDAATQGDWIGAYGGDGYTLANDGVDLPAYASVAASPGTQTAQWTGSTSDVRALRKDSGSGRQASTWYSSTQFTIDVDMTDGLVHRVGLYMVDWDSTDRSQEIELIDAATGTVLGRRTVSSFHDGVYLEWEARGHVQLRVTRLAGANAVVSAVFFDAGVAAPTVGDAGFEQVAVGSGNYAYAPTGSAWTFMSASGAGSGVSGDGSAFTSGNPDAPEGGQVAFLQGASTITQIVSGWAAGSYAISFQAAQRGNFGTSNQTVEVTVDGVVVAEVTPSGTSYQTYTTPSFTVTAGAHTIQFLGLVDDDETVFLDAVAVVSRSASAAAAAFVAEDSTTQGDWIGSYGGDGYTLANDGVDLPAYASVATSPGTQTAQWTGSTSDVRALRKDSGSGRQASTWYSSTQFTIDVDMTDGLAHRVGLYMVDWDTTARSQRIDVVDADTGATIDSRTVSSFHDGVYLEWEVRGHVQLRVTCLAGLNAVVSGVFLDAGAGVLPDAPGRWTLYDGFDPVLDFNDAGTPTARYLDGPSAAGVDAVLAREVSGSTAWYLGDRLGTIRDLIDDSGAVVDHVDYNAYGGTEAESAPSAGDRYVSFAGLVRDITVGLNLAVYRVQDPATGRWLSEDPLGFEAGDSNLLRYVGNTPITLIDPSGLFDGPEGDLIDGYLRRRGGPLTPGHNPLSGPTNLGPTGTAITGGGGYIDINAGGPIFDVPVGGGIQIEIKPGMGLTGVYPYLGFQVPGCSINVAPGQTVSTGIAVGGGYYMPVVIPIVGVPYQYWMAGQILYPAFYVFPGIPGKILPGMTTPLIPVAGTPGSGMLPLGPGFQIGLGGVLGSGLCGYYEIGAGTPGSGTGIWYVFPSIW